MNNSLINLIDLEQQLQQQSPQKIIKHALTEFENISISFSGAEDVVLIEMARNYKPNINVFCLDTGRLHPETYRYIEKIRKHYGIAIEVISPDGEAVRKLVSEKGLFSFYEDDHKECCGIRKIEPLRKKLATVDAWITGQRKDQSPTRAEIPVVQNDALFARANSTLTKFNPLANWTSKEVWDYIRMCELPYNELHNKGYVSIGCEPCTRPIGPNQHEREGRWWWEEATKKECGLHVDSGK
ncbi:MAG: phosphoadenylyl-sulfate reductase [Pseudomonadota bacterium]